MYRLQCIEKTYNSRTAELGSGLIGEDYIVDKVIKSVDYLITVAARLCKKYHIDSTFKTDGSGYLFNLNTVNSGPLCIEKFYNLIVTKDNKPLDTYVNQSLNFKILKRSGVQPVGRHVKKRLARPASIRDGRKKS